MTLLSLQEIVEEYDARKVSVRVIIGGALLPKVSSVDYQFEIGQVPTATIVVPKLSVLPLAVQEEASVEIWFGYRVGVALREKLVFGGAIVDSIGHNGDEVIIEAVMDGPRKLSYGYNRRIQYEFETVTAEEAVIALMAFAGVSNYVVNLPAWLIGTAVPQQLEFSSYGEAINKVAEVDGSPWYAMPTGQVRVETRDPIPSPAPRRIYHSSVLIGTTEAQPLEVSNPEARPRVLEVSRRSYRSEVANFIEVDGAVITTLGPQGEQNSEQIFEQVSGPTGHFPNGAWWIPIPPLFQDFTLSNELIDTNAKAFEVAERYFELKNRLMEKVSLQVPGDPDVFLGSTVRVVDKYHSGTNSLYFIEGYKSSISENEAITELSLTGGPESGTTGQARPFADFYWTYQALYFITPGGPGNLANYDLGPNTKPAQKLCEDVPDDNQNEDNTDRFTEDATSRRLVIIGLDATVSDDFDGYIVSYAWEWTDGASVVHNLTGPRQIIMVDPDLTTSISMKLTVTDNNGLTDDITKTIYTSSQYISLSTGLPANDPTMNDTENGGGEIIGDCTDCEDTDDCGPPEPEACLYGGCEDPDPENPSPGKCNGLTSGFFIAAGGFAMGSKDNRTWNDISKATAGVGGDFISVASGIVVQNQASYGLFGTTEGEVILTDDICLTSTLVLSIPGGGRVERIQFDMSSMGDPSQGPNVQNETNFSFPIYTQASPGTLTIREAYHQALAVGFSNDSAILAVAILLAESGLVSNATNTAGNNPPSTDRGIAQINDYWHPEVSDACAFNTECAITEMLRISSGGSDFTPWSAFNAGTHAQYIDTIMTELGLDGPPEPGPFRQQQASSFRAWLVTSRGEIWSSPDSGRNWGLYKTFRDGYPLNELMTTKEFSLDPSGIVNLAIFGGTTNDKYSLIRVSTSGQGDFQGLDFAGDLAAQIAANTNRTIKYAASNGSAVLIAFDGGVTPRCWVNRDPIGSPDGWEATDGISGEVTAVAGGFEGEFIVACGDNLFVTTDNINFVAA